MAVASIRSSGYAPLVAGAIAAAGGASVAIIQQISGSAEALGLLALPVVVALLLRSVWWACAGVVAVICVVPFATLPFGGPVTPTLLELALITWAVLLGAVTLVDRTQELRIGPAHVLWLLLAGVCVFAFLLGIGRGYTNETLHTFFSFMLALGVFVLMAHQVQRAVDAVLVLRLLLLGTSGAAAVALALYAAGAAFTERVLLRLVPYGYPGSRIVRYIEDDPNRPMRAVGTSVDPNSFGGLLMIGFVLGVACLVTHRTIAPRWLALGASGLCGTALLLTYSRGAWVGAFIGLVVLLGMRQRKWLPALGLFGAAAIALGLGRGFVERLWLGFTLQDPATRLRLAEYQNAWEIIRRHPWFGVGFGDAPSIDLQAGVSSVYLTIAERAGLMGVAAFALVIIVTGWNALRLVRSPGLVGDVSLALGAAFASALTAGLFDHYFFNPRFAHMAALFWLIVGALVALSQPRSGTGWSFQPQASAVRSQQSLSVDHHRGNFEVKGHTDAGPTA
ncbi:MAG: polymerase [Chloroflexi bacterium]|nr:MAG: polymerase [Chloroflexota bacterium]